MYPERNKQRQRYGVCRANDAIRDPSEGFVGRLRTNGIAGDRDFPSRDARNLDIWFAWTLASVYSYIRHVFERGRFQVHGRYGEWLRPPLSNATIQLRARSFASFRDSSFLGLPTKVHGCRVAISRDDRQARTSLLCDLRVDQTSEASPRCSVSNIFRRISTSLSSTGQASIRKINIAVFV